MGFQIAWAGTAALTVALTAPLGAAPSVPSVDEPAAAVAPAKPTWREQETDDSPRMPVNAVMVFDESRDETVLFGGHPGYAPDAEAETWTWDGTDWTQLQPAVSPGARYGQGMAYDPVRDEVVIYGGQSVSRFKLYRPQTWTFSDGTWKKRHPSGRPGRVYRAAMAFDPNLQQVVLFGGYNRGKKALTNETWTWDGRSWTELHPATSPSPRNAADLVYDPTRDALVLFGGATGPNGTDPVDDTWSWDGTTWTRETVAESPSPRMLHGTATFGDHVVVFGGTTDEFEEPDLGDTWVLEEDTWRKLSTGRAPAARSDLSMTWDPVRAEAVLFGGVSTSPRFDTWTLAP